MRILTLIICLLLVQSSLFAQDIEAGSPGQQPPEKADLKRAIEFIKNINLTFQKLDAFDESWLIWDYYAIQESDDYIFLLTIRSNEGHKLPGPLIIKNKKTGQFLRSNFTAYDFAWDSSHNTLLIGTVIQDYCPFKIQGTNLHKSILQVLAKIFKVTEKEIQNASCPLGETDDLSLNVMAKISLPGGEAEFLLTYLGGELINILPDGIILTQAAKSGGSLTPSPYAKFYAIYYMDKIHLVELQRGTYHIKSAYTVNPEDWEEIRSTKFNKKFTFFSSSIDEKIPKEIISRLSKNLIKE